MLFSMIDLLKLICNWAKEANRSMKKNFNDTHVLHFHSESEYFVSLIARVTLKEGKEVNQKKTVTT